MQLPASAALPPCETEPVRDDRKSGTVCVFYEGEMIGNGDKGKAEVSLSLIFFSSWHRPPPGGQAELA